MKVTEERIDECLAAMKDWRDTDCSGTAVTWTDWTLELLGFHDDKHIPAFAVLVSRAADLDKTDVNLELEAGIIEALETYESSPFNVIGLMVQAAQFARRSIPGWVVGSDRDELEQNRADADLYLASHRFEAACKEAGAY